MSQSQMTKTLKLVNATDKEVDDKLAVETKDPSSADSSLWRLTSWAEGMCGQPRVAVQQLWKGRGAIEKAFKAQQTTKSNKGLSARDLGRTFTKAWLASRVKQSGAGAGMLEKMVEADANIGGLLMYLEMVVALVPDVTAQRLSLIWKLPEPAWVNPVPEVVPAAIEAITVKYAKPAKEPGAKPAPPVVLKVKKWCMTRSFKLCKNGEERVFRNKLTLLPGDITSVRAGVDCMNAKKSVDEACVIHNANTGHYYCLYRQGERNTALGMLGIEEPCGFLSVTIKAAYNLVAGRSDRADPYAVCKVGRDEFRTKIIKDDLHPVWNSEAFQFHVNTCDEERKTLHIEVFNKHGRQRMGEFMEGTAETSFGSALLDLSELAVNRKEKKILALTSGGLGQIEVELELVTKREYGSRLSSANKQAVAVKKRSRRVKPTWGILEQEMVYDREIASFLETIQPADEHTTPRHPDGYQAKLHNYINGGFEAAKPDVTCTCGNSYKTASVFCEMCGAIRPGREEKAMAAGRSPQNAIADGSPQQALADAPMQKAITDGAGLLPIARQPELTAVYSVTPAQAEPGVLNALGEGGKQAKAGRRGSVAARTDQASEGVLLRCLPEEEPEIFASVEAFPKSEKGRIPLNGLVRVSGPPVSVNKQWLVPIEPTGYLVRLGMFGVAEGLPEGPMTLHVAISHGKNLKRPLFMGVPTLWVHCSVPGRRDTGTFQTKKIKALDPAWQEKHPISGFKVGDSLEFKIGDKDTQMASGNLGSDLIFPNQGPHGFDNYLPLSLDGATLRITVSLEPILSSSDRRTLKEEPQRGKSILKSSGGAEQIKNSPRGSRAPLRVGTRVRIDDPDSD